MISPDVLVRRAIAGFVAIALAVGVVVSLGAVWIADVVTRADAVEDAEETAQLVQRAVVAALEGDADSDAEGHFAAVLLPQVQAGTLVRVKVWEHASADRLRLVYSDLAELIGQEKHLRLDRAELLGTSGTLVLPVPDDEAHRTEFTAGLDLVEVFTSFSSGERDYLLESYFVTTASEKTARLRAHLLPVLLGGMVLFAAAMLPLAGILARRLSRAERERTLLIDRATRERESERMRLGQQLHDGVVQDLAGASLALSVLASSPRPDQERIESVAGILRRDVQALRGLLDDLVPADLAWSGLAAALHACADDVGTPADIEVAARPAADAHATQLLYRAARELLSNAARHAHAHAVTVTASCDGEWARLSVSDDGTGFDPAASVAAGHVGLRIVEHAVKDAGGGMTVVSRPGGGTTVAVWIHADAPATGIPPGGRR